jgi:hypothetical protein
MHSTKRVGRLGKKETLSFGYGIVLLIPEVFREGRALDLRVNHSANKNAISRQRTLKPNKNMGCFL